MWRLSILESELYRRWRTELIKKFFAIEMKIEPLSIRTRLGMISKTPPCKGRWHSVRRVVWKTANTKFKGQIDYCYG